MSFGHHYQASPLNERFRCLEGREGDTSRRNITFQWARASGRDAGAQRMATMEYPEM